MKIAICDDEEEYIRDVERHINQYCFEHGVTVEIYKYNNGKDLLEENVKFNIAFLDIEMDEMNGIEIGRRLQKSNPEIVLIYVTAYEHYLDDALDLGITRFFSKPIDSQRFYKGFERAINKADNAEIIFHIKDQHNGNVTIRSNDIVYVEITGRKTKVVDKNGKEYYSRDNIKDWQKKLSKSYFISPHHSFIINSNYITYFQKDYIKLNDKYTIPLAYSKRVEFRRKYMMMLEG